MSESFTFVDAASPSNVDEVWYVGNFLQPDSEIFYDFTPNNTTVTIENWQAVAMYRGIDR